MSETPYLEGFSPALELFLENLTYAGLEHFRIMYGVYRAFVVHNDDPENRGRIQVSSPPFGEPGVALDVWLDPTFPGAGVDRGFFWPPEVGDTVWVAYDNGRPDRPKWYTGGWHGEQDVPKQFSTTITPPRAGGVPERRGFITRMGHMLVFDDSDDGEALSLVWHKADSTDLARTDRTRSADREIGECSTLLFRPNGDVLVTNSIGATIHLDAENQEVKILSPQEKGGDAAQISMTEDGIRLVDDTGKNMILIDKGKINIISKGDVTVNAPLLTAETGGTNLSAGNREKIILGDTYTQARGQMNVQVGTALQNSGIGWTVLGPVAQALVPVITALPIITEAPLLIAALVPLIQAIAQAGVSIGPTHTSAAIAIQTFEAKAQTYLSKVTKSA